MATLRVTSLEVELQGPRELPDGAVVAGVTTTGSAIVGTVVTINATDVDALFSVLSLLHHLLETGNVFE